MLPVPFWLPENDWQLSNKDRCQGLITPCHSRKLSPLRFGVNYSGFLLYDSRPHTPSWRKVRAKFLLRAWLWMIRVSRAFFVPLGIERKLNHLNIRRIWEQSEYQKKKADSWIWVDFLTSTNPVASQGWRNCIMGRTLFWSGVVTISTTFPLNRQSMNPLSETRAVLVVQPIFFRLHEQESNRKVLLLVPKNVVFRSFSQKGLIAFMEKSITDQLSCCRKQFMGCERCKGCIFVM